MRNTSISNKRQRKPFIDNNHVPNIIHITLLTVRYDKEVYGRLKKEVADP